MRRTRSAACALTLAWCAAAACGGSGPDQAGLAGPRVPPPERAALGFVRLSARSEEPLDASRLLRLGPGRYALPDPFEPGFWELRPSADTARPSWLVRLEPGRDRVLVAGTGPAGVGSILSGGRLVVWDATRDSIRARQTLQPGMPGRARALRGLPDGSWAELRTELGGSTGSLALTLIRHAPGRASVPLWRRRLGGPWDVALDMSGLTAVGDTLYVSGASPPRVLRIPAAAPRTAEEVRLTGMPERRMPEFLRRELAAELARAPGGHRMEAPDLFPAVYAVWPRGQGLLVAAITGENSVGLDWYCDGTYRRTLAATPEIRSVHAFEDAVVLHFDDPRTGDQLLGFYAPAQFALDCPAAAQ